MKDLFFEITFALTVIAILGAGGGNTHEPLERFTPELAIVPAVGQQVPDLLNPALSAEHRVEFVALGTLPLHPMVTG